MAKSKNTAQRSILQKQQSHHSEAERHGFDLDNWNAAIGLQVTIRDAIGYPVSMQEAIDVAKEMCRLVPESKRKNFGKQLREHAELVKQARLDEIERNKREIGPHGRGQQTG